MAFLTGATAAVSAGSGILSAGKKIFKPISGLFGGGGKEWKNKPRSYKNAPENAVSFFKHSEFRGDYFAAGSGEDETNLKGSGWNDQISAIKVPPGMSVTVYSDKNFGGRSKTLYTDTDFNDLKWNDDISSYKVRGTAGSSRPQNFKDLKAITPEKVNTGGQRYSTQGVPANAGGGYLTPVNLGIAGAVVSVIAVLIYTR